MEQPAGTDSPATPAASVEDVWQLDSTAPGAQSVPATAELNGTSLRNVVMESVSRILKDHAGPMQYLMNRWENPGEKQEYVKWLWESFPPDDAHQPLRGLPLPVRPVEGDAQGEGQRPFTIHVAMLSFDPLTSPKEPTRAKTCSELVDSIMTDTFLTKHEPLLLCSGGVQTTKARHKRGVDPTWGAEPDVIPPLAIGHHKSAARVSTLHLLLTMFKDDAVDMSKAHARLWQSIRQIKAYELQFANARDEAFSNFKMSAQGAIRRPPNVVSWCVVLNRLRNHGETDVGNVVRLWNAQSTRGSQLTGGKAQSVKNLLDLCDQRTMDLILECVSRHGWEQCPFSDDCLSTKKVFPGVHWRASTRAWTERQTVTAQSTFNMFSHIITCHRNAPSVLRKKLNKTQLEERAVTAAMITATAHELANLGAIPERLLEQEWLEPWIRGDQKVEMEMASAWMEKSSNFTVRDIPTLRRLLDSRGNSRNGTLALEEQTVQWQSQELEASTFDLTMRKLEYDCNVWRVYKGKVEHWHRRVLAKEQEWNLKRHENAKLAVEDHWRTRFALVNPSSEVDVICEYQSHTKALAERHSIPLASVITIGFLNWVSPCSLPNPLLESHANCVSFLASGSDRNIMPILFPQFCYKKGQLYLSEQMVMNLLSRRCVNFDVKWGLRFESRSDARDLRPLLYDGRVALPNGIIDGDYFWRDSKLLRGFTSPASMLPGKALQCIEDVSESALPSSTDLDGTVKGANKFAQVGQDAMERVLDALFEGVSIDHNSAVVFWEMNLGWGNMLDAVISKSSGWKFPWLYFSSSDNAVQHEWIEHIKKQTLKDMFLEDKIMVPGHRNMPKNMPSNLAMQPPHLPELGELVVKTVQTAGSSVGSASGEGKVLSIPDALVKTWYHHKTHGEKFRAFVELFQEEFNDRAVVVQEDAKADDAGTANQTPAKRTTPDTNNSPNAKRTKVHADRVIRVEELPTTVELASLDLTQKNQKGKLSMYTGDAVYLVNSAADEFLLPEGSMLAGYGKGKFKLKALDDDAHASRKIDFMLKSSKDKIYHNYTVQTIGDVVLEKRKSEPNCKVAYHDLEEVADGGVGEFNLSLKVPVRFLCAEEAPKATQLSAACFVPQHCFEQPGVCEIMWATRWCVQGLSPVRPLVITCVDIELKPGHALRIAPAA